LIFIFDFTSFGVILLLGGPRFATLEVEIYYQTVSLFNLPMAATLALIQLGFTVILTILYTRLTYRISRPLALRPLAYTQRSPANWQERLFAVLVAGSLLIFLVLPMLTLAARSITRLDAIPKKPSEASASTPLTLDFYRELSINRRQSIFYSPPTTAIAVSVGYAAITVILALAFGLPAAWSLAYDTRSLVNRAMDPLLMLPLGTSAVTLGLGFIVALDEPPLDLRASLLLVPLAHTLVALPIVVRSLTPALRSIRPRLRHSASVLGASPRQVFRYIELPLVGRAVLVAAIFAFTISLGEFGATALIARPEYPTVPLAIYRFASQPGALNYGQALALSTILMVITTLGILTIERFRIADIGEF
jgi:thiamine transport system permease protein